MAIVTVARTLGSWGDRVASALAEELGFTLVDRERLEDSIKEHGLESLGFGSIDEEMGENYLGGRELDSTIDLHIDLIRTLIADIALSKNVVITGRGGQFLFRGFPSALHLLVVASLPNRITWLREEQRINAKKAARAIAENDRSRRNYIQYLYGEEWLEPNHYDLVINMDHLTISDTVELAVNAVNLKGITGYETETTERLEVLKFNSMSRLADLLVEQHSQILRPQKAFANASEEKFARLLDFYRVTWEYEPKTFPLAWDEDGKVVEAFTPDFYLPEQDFYIELTTMKQSLVTKKNRKVRQLRELYPDINIKIFYEKDYHRLFHKYEATQEEEPVIEEESTSSEQVDEKED